MIASHNVDAGGDQPPTPDDGDVTWSYRARAAAMSAWALMARAAAGLAVIIGA